MLLHSTSPAVSPGNFGVAYVQCELLLHSPVLMVWLQEDASMRMVCQCIEADDIFHACWEDSATRDHHNAVERMYKK